MFPTYHKDIDVEIGAQIDDDILTELCCSNKYVNSICSEIWRRKLKLLYPDFPILDKKFYNLVTNSFVELKEYAEKSGYKSVLDWLEIPEHDINYMLEFKPELETIGAQIKYKIEQKKKLEAYLADDIIPEQKSIDIAFIIGNLHFIQILINYDFFPSQDAVDEAMLMGNFYSPLAEIDIFPSQDSINFAVGNGRTGVIEIFDYDIFPDQEYINFAAEQGYGEIIHYLAEKGLFPDRESIDIARERGFDEVLEHFEQQ